MELKNIWVKAWSFLSHIIVIKVEKLLTLIKWFYKEEQRRQFKICLIKFGFTKLKLQDLKDMHIFYLHFCFLCANIPFFWETMPMSFIQTVLHYNGSGSILGPWYFRVYFLVDVDKCMLQIRCLALLSAIQKKKTELKR